MVLSPELEETATVLKEISRIFESDEDIKVVQSIQRKREDIQRLIVERESQVKKQEEDWSKKLDQAEADAQRREPIESHTRRVRNYEEQKAQVERNVEHLETESENYALEVRQLEEQRQKLITAGRDVRKEIERTLVPRAQSLLSMYTLIAPISWDLHQMERLKGHLYLEEKQDVIPFDFDPNTHSRHYIANYLWDSLE